MNNLQSCHTRLITNIMKVFVHTGTGFDNCQAAIPVEIDLIESGMTTSIRYFHHLLNTLQVFKTVHEI